MSNLTQYLDENYPSSNRSSIINLDLSNKNFVGNVEDLDSSFINSGGSHSYYMLRELDLSNKKYYSSSKHRTITGTTSNNNPATSHPNDNLGLKIGLSVGIIAAFLLELVTFLCYKYKIRKNELRYCEYHDRQKVMFFHSYYADEEDIINEKLFPSAQLTNFALSSKEIVLG
ncbi:2697_t:CDS:2 [Diversispora eburnea]|uniref:2697_t:CDS:1 n=1 Tax=Diversispora eburnea TaxID=1213867 RepID=A0A9N8YU43_9GLOM|nr:2697_t:CDS:2 [Diversispora eburnea]